MSILDKWCPEGVIDPDSVNPEQDFGDWSGVTKPEYESQKNFVRLAFDPRTSHVLALQGGLGAFFESPATSQKVIMTMNCNKSWQFRSDLDGVMPLVGEMHEWQPATNVHSLIQAVIPGPQPHSWILINGPGDYIISYDDGLTWTEPVNAAIGATIHPHWVWPEFYGTLGVVGSIETRVNTNIAYNHEAGVVAYAYVDSLWFGLGIRRGTFDGSDYQWDQGLNHGDEVGEGGDIVFVPESGWFSQSRSPHLVIDYANGVWIAVAGYQGTLDYSDFRTPAMRINPTPNMDPESWGEPFWPVSETFYSDVYEGTVSDEDLSPTNKGFDFWSGRGRLKFIPQFNHPAGGRWWLLGRPDSLLFSDDNGQTWSKSLADHTGPEENMHPMLNWRRSHELEGSPIIPDSSQITDIIGGPGESGELIAIGMTYPRDGIVNRYAAYCCSVDGGNTWGAVQQLPFTRSFLPVDSTGDVSDIIGRHIFPCNKFPSEVA